LFPHQNHPRRRAFFNPAGAFSANPFRRHAPMQTATLFLTYQK